MNKSTLKFKWNRLRAMGLPEILHRSSQVAISQLGKNPLISGREKETWHTFLTRHHLNSNHNGEKSDMENYQGLLRDFRNRELFSWQYIELSALREIFELDYNQNIKATLNTAHDLLMHQFQVFDRTIQFKEKVDWHFDAIGEQSIPLLYWTKLDYRDPLVVTDVKYVWELNRHQHFITLAKAYLFSGNDSYAEELFIQWQEWIEKNPFHYGVNWTNSLELAIRLISWTWALQMAKNSSALTPTTYVSILNSIENHAEHIFNFLSKYSSANNHLVGEALGLIYAGSYYPEFRQAEKWRQKGFQIIFEQLPGQLYPDGVLKEQAFYYQRYLFDFGIHARFAAQYVNIDIPKEFENALLKIARFIQACMDSNSNIPQIGDEDGGQAIQLSELSENPYNAILSTAAVVYNDPEFKGYRKNFDETCFWVNGLDGQARYDKLEYKGSKNSLKTFHDGGYVIIKDTDNDVHFLFDCGPLGFGPLAAHGHADALSFTASVKGESIFVDSGTYRYQCARKWRNYFRGTFAHNTIVVDGMDQSEPLGTFQWGKKATTHLKEIEKNNGKLTLIAEHDGYEKIGVLHRRRIRFEKWNCWVIEDILLGKGEHKLQSLLHLNPCEYDLLNVDTVQARFQNTNVKVQFVSEYPFHLDVLEGQTDPVMGWQSRGYGFKNPQPVIVVSLKVVLPVQLFTFINCE